MIDRREIIQGGAAVAVAAIPLMASAVHALEATDLVARKGQVVVCTEGHEICEVAVDIPRRGVMSLSQFTNWKQTEPRSGDDVLPCEKCGSDFIVWRGGFRHLVTRDDA